jgi:ribosomal protein S13
MEAQPARPGEEEKVPETEEAEATNVVDICKKAEIDANKPARELTAEEIEKLVTIIQEEKMLQDQTFPEDDKDTSVAEQDVELPVAIHEFIMHQDAKERQEIVDEQEEMEFHQKISASISRAALKDSIYDRARQSYGNFKDEEDELALKEDTHADRIKKMRAERLTAQKKVDAKNQRMMIQRLVAEKDMEPKVTHFEAKRLVKQEEPGRQDVEYPEEEKTALENESAPTIERDETTIFDDLNCGACIDPLAWDRLRNNVIQKCFKPEQGKKEDPEAAF